MAPREQPARAATSSNCVFSNPNSANSDCAASRIFALVVSVRAWGLFFRVLTGRGILEILFDEVTRPFIRIIIKPTRMFLKGKKFPPHDERRADQFLSSNGV